jgi:N-acetylmuramic acid 6-phosphate etherase
MPSKSPKPPVTERVNPASTSLDTKALPQILRIINREDKKVPAAVARVLPEVARAVELAVGALTHGGRLVYLGAGSSGRLGVLDAAECMPTFGIDQVIAVMAGAPDSLFRASEVSEDDPQKGVDDLRRIHFNPRDVLVGISASGRTPYVLGGLRHARRLRARTVVLTANPDAPAQRYADVMIAPVVGPEVIAGSTRMKAGTAQKLILNMLSTATMVRLGRVFSNLMSHVQLTNTKLRERAQRVLMEATGASAVEARRALKAAHGRLPVALRMLSKGVPGAQAERLLGTGGKSPQSGTKAHRLAKSRKTLTH